MKYPALPFLILGGLFLLTGCLTMQGVHQSCTQPQMSFPAQVSCINRTMAENNAFFGDSYAQEYRQHAAVLLERFEQGKISEKEAKLSLTEKLNDLEREQWQAQAAQNQAYEKPYPTITNCRQIDGELHCRSY